MKQNSNRQNQKPLFLRKVTREELNSLVDRAADLIRTAVDYKFILVLLFLKHISDKWKAETEQAADRLVKEVGLPYELAVKEAQSFVYHTYNIPEELLWDEITKDVQKLPTKLALAINEIAQRNKDLDGVINRVDFLEFARNEENRIILHRLIQLFDQYNLGGEEVSPDILGDAYEHILSRFLPEKGKEGEIYTPRELIRLMVEILDPKPGERVYDPSCGSGGMLIISYMFVKEKYGKEEANRLFLYGQEKSQDIYAICRLNLLIHDIRNAEIYPGDTLLYPKTKREDGRLEQFDVVIANIPWNQDRYGEMTLRDAELNERFSYGFPPDNSADWAWVQHMLASAKEDGRIGLVVDNGCLFRSGREKVIRSKVIEDDLIECVILTPEKLFYNTGAPGAIIIFNKRKPEERKGKILFINGGKEFAPHPSIRRLNSLSKENIEKIVDAYKKFADIPGFARVVDKEEVVKNDYNLNVTLYVMPVEEEERVDIMREFWELKELERERDEVMRKLEGYIEEIINLNEI
ncbi:N-6 DNA methylase [bacterium]|nr:N-6 DNA methylase [bacterium]